MGPQAKMGAASGGPVVPGTSQQPSSIPSAHQGTQNGHMQGVPKGDMKGARKGKMKSSMKGGGKCRGGYCGK